MSELDIAGQPPVSLDIVKYMRKTRGGKIKTATKSKSNRAIKITLFVLLALTIYGFLTFDYKNVDIAKAMAGTWNNVKVLFGQPKLTYGTWGGSLKALFVTFSLGALATIFGAIIAFRFLAVR